MMKTRRDFIRAMSLGSVGVATGLAGCQRGEGNKAPAVHSGKTIKWKMVTFWPKNFPALGTGANFLAKSIEKMSAGRIEVKVYGSGELVPALGIFDAVSRGTAELGHSAPYYWKGKHAAMQFFAGIPFGLTAWEQNGWIAHGGGQALWDELYAPFNIKPFLAGNTGVQMAGWFNKPIQTVADFKGLKMRIPGIGGDVLRELGTAVVNLPGGEIFQALRSGAIDATEWIGPYNDLAFGLHKAAKYYYGPGWHEPGISLECLVNKKAFEALTPDLRAIVATASAATNDYILSEFSARNADALSTLVTKHKVTLKSFSPEILSKLGKVSKQIVEKVGNTDTLSKKIYGSLLTYRKKMLSWSAVSDQPFQLARSQVL